MQKIINTFLKYIKWPLALLMILTFLPVLKADIRLLQETTNISFVTKFIVPIVAILAVWFVIPGLNGSHFAIFEHEFTHMMTALITFHKPKSLRIDPDKGGAFGYYGEGNWLITLAPYFVPTFPIFLMIFSSVWLGLGQPLPEWFLPILGVMFGYHLISNAAQIHPEQTDFAKAGWIFSFLFLPTANLLAVGFVWAFAAYSWDGVAKWWNLILHYSETMLKNLF